MLADDAWQTNIFFFASDSPHFRGKGTVDWKHDTSAFLCQMVTDEFRFPVVPFIQPIPHGSNEIRIGFHIDDSLSQLIHLFVVRCLCIEIEIDFQQQLLYAAIDVVFHNLNVRVACEFEHFAKDFGARLQKAQKRDDE